MQLRPPARTGYNTESANALVCFLLRMVFAVGRSNFHYTPQPRFFNLAKMYIGIIKCPGQLDEVFCEAMRQAQIGKLGTVFIQRPESYWDGGWTAKPEGRAVKKRGRGR